MQIPAGPDIPSVALPYCNIMPRIQSANPNLRDIFFLRSDTIPHRLPASRPIVPVCAPIFLRLCSMTRRYLPADPALSISINTIACNSMPRAGGMSRRRTATGGCRKGGAVSSGGRAVHDPARPAHAGEERCKLGGVKLTSAVCSANSTSRLRSLGRPPCGSRASALRHGPSITA